MTLRSLCILLAFILCQYVSAQNNTIIQLDEVEISDDNLREFSKSQSVLALTDSTITKNNPSLTDLLKFTTPIYFKENGYGMVSSASFRGTTAQQTAVIWNGINVNSHFNGQTDFNSISTKSFNQIDVKSGGGSVIYGTSAIGGSVHLNNNLSFSNYSVNHELSYGIGSFNSHQTHYTINTSTNKWSVNASVDRNTSDNDYELPNGLQNINGEFENFAVSASAGLKLNPNHMLKIYSHFANNDKNFSLISPSDTKTKYTDEVARNLVEWQFNNGIITSNLKAAILVEEYQYFENASVDDYSGSSARTFIAKHELGYKFSKSQIKSIVEYNTTASEGNDIGTSTRSVAATSVLFSQKPTNKLYYEVGARQELANTYNSPLLFSGGAKYAFAKNVALIINGSRNFRIPSFNDLHWNGVGNTNLKPETSYQGEIGTEFQHRFTKIGVNLFYIDITDMIQWLPGQTTLWLPRNIQQVTSQGLEIIGNSAVNIGTNKFQISGTYSFTSSQNGEDNQLIYVPKHRGNIALAYARENLSTYVQILYNGEVFTRTDNNPRYIIDEHTVANFGVSYSFTPLTLGLKVLNVFDLDYYAIDRRPFPGRHFNLYINLNF